MDCCINLQLDLHVKCNVEMLFEQYTPICSKYQLHLYWPGSIHLFILLLIMIRPIQTVHAHLHSLFLSKIVYRAFVTRFFIKMIFSFGLLSFWITVGLSTALDEQEANAMFIHNLNSTSYGSRRHLWLQCPCHHSFVQSSQ